MMREKIFAVPRDLFLAFIVIWLTNPSQVFIENWYIYGALWIGWIIFACLSNNGAFFQAFLNKASLLAFTWPIAVCLMSFFGWADFALYQFTIPFLLLTFRYYVNGNYIKSLKFFVFVYFCYVIVININSIIALEINDEISRILASADKSITAQYASPTMANFQHVNNMAVCGISCLGCVKYLNKNFINKLVLVVLTVTIVVLLISAQYSIALFSFAIFTIFILCSNYRRKISPIKFLIVCIFSVFSIMFIGTILSNIASNMAEGYVQRRLQSIGSLLLGGGLDTDSDLYARLYLYVLSIKTFFSNFFFGVGGIEQYANGLVGGHSTLLDNFAYYGVFFGALFVFYMVVCMKNIVACFQGEFKKITKIIFAMYFIFMLLNTCYSEQMLFAVFFIYPALVYVGMKKQNEKQCLAVKLNENQG